MLSTAEVAPVVQGPVLAKVSDVSVETDPNYAFAYDVQDAITGDSKAHVENRSGGIVKGQYSFNDADGTRRIVDYTADPVNGFNAVVRKAPLVVITNTPVVTEPLVATSVGVAPLKAKPIVAPLVARTASIKAAPVKAAKLEEFDTVAVEAAPDVPASPGLAVGAAPVAAVPALPSVPVARAATQVFQASYIASPVFTSYSSFATPLAYTLG